MNRSKNLFIIRGLGFLILLGLFFAGLMERPVNSAPAPSPSVTTPPTISTGGPLVAVPDPNIVNYNKQSSDAYNAQTGQTTIPGVGCYYVVSVNVDPNPPLGHKIVTTERDTYWSTPPLNNVNGDLISVSIVIDDLVVGENPAGLPIGMMTETSWVYSVNPSNFAWTLYPNYPKTVTYTPSSNGNLDILPSPPPSPATGK